MVSPCKERHNKNYIIDTTSGVINVKLITCSSDYVILSWWLYMEVMSNILSLN